MKRFISLIFSIFVLLGITVFTFIHKGKDENKGVIIEERFKKRAFQDTVKAVIRYLESRNNYSAVDPGNTYFGAFQMNFTIISMFDSAFSKDRDINSFLSNKERQERAMDKSMMYYDSLFTPLIKRVGYINKFPSGWWIYLSHRYGICATYYFMKDLMENNKD